MNTSSRSAAAKVVTAALALVCLAPAAQTLSH